MIETALISLITGNAGVSALIGTRMVPFTDTNTLTLPRLTYWRTNSERPISNSGPTGQCIATFQLDAWAPDAATSWQVLEAVRKALNGFSGSNSGMTIDSVRWQDQSDQINTPALPGVQKSTQRMTATIVVSYTDATS